MKKISIAFIGFALSAPSFVSAQSDIDALRYSQSYLTGTARYVGLGGAFGALGADFSALSDNPGGIGLYRKSEFTFTPSITSEQSTSQFLSQAGSDNKFNFNIGNLGLVFTKPLSRDNTSDGWKSINFAIGYNRLADFNTRTSYQGVNNNNSYLDYILQGANGTATQNLDQFYQNLAYQTYLIDTTYDNNHYRSVIPYAGELQRRSSETSGSSGEVVISLGANYGNRLYIGGTLGIDYLNYTENTNYQELDPNNTIPDFNSFTLAQNLITTGVGVNFKFGMIFSATDWLRLGAAVHTPTFYSMHDDYSNTMTSTFDDGTSYVWSSPQGSFDYSLATPFKAIGSAAFIIGKMGLVSADYEYVDYSNMDLSSSSIPGAFFDVNNTIHQKYTATGNIKLGTEWRIATVYRVRAGYDLFGSPFASGEAIPGADQAKTAYSVGFGVRDKGFSVDLAYAYSITHDYVQEYSLFNPTNNTPISVPGAINKIETNNFLLTLGFRF